MTDTSAAGDDSLLRQGAPDREQHAGTGPTAADGPDRHETPRPSDGRTRLAYLLGVPLADDVDRQWPQMQEVVHGAELIGRVEGSFPELTLAVGRRSALGDLLVVEWTCDYGDGRLYRNVTLAELRDGLAVRVTDYWGAPTDTPAWRRPVTARLPMPGDGTWPDRAHLEHH